jgi:hypothetical protein
MIKRGLFALVSGLVFTAPSISAREVAPIEKSDIVSIFEVVDAFHSDTRYLLDSAQTEGFIPLLQNAEVLALLADEFHFAVYSFAPDSLEAAVKFNDIAGIFHNIELIVRHEELSLQTRNDFEYLKESFGLLLQFYDSLK